MEREEKKLPILNEGNSSSLSISSPVTGDVELKVLEGGEYIVKVPILPTAIQGEHT
ncbi:hypothetical protein [Pontibacillus salipaludis]|uniref:Uncharacterized protein n=1 Tax=Pontibacillus salipaludis TaxID=1697394 RepID=A0ABQ1Q130_9BACI|nr:hypothetical protein [Pontibacillus salipaludis]GGD09998.1 hypothetical protein GCM10011389_16910 [Pontibacillus salipaludis]